MSPETTGLVGLMLLIVLLFARMWIGAAMAMVGFLGYAYIMGLKPAFAVVDIVKPDRALETLGDFIDEIQAQPLAVVLGQVASDVSSEELKAGMNVELVLETLYEDDESEYLVWKWKPLAD